MSISNRKVVIVGAGHVGSHVGYALISQSLADEIVYIDSDHAKAVAQAFDLTDATNYLPVRTKVTAGDYSDAKDAQIMIISAGPLPTGNQTRMDTLGQTIAILKDVTKSIKESGFDGIIVNISNPADVITHYIQHTLNWAPERIFSTSTTLDSARLRRAIAQEIGIDQKSITAYALGEHGESQMVAWSAVTIAGKPLSQWREEYPDTFGKLDLDALADAGREGGWTILRGKQCTEFGIGASAVRKQQRARPGQQQSGQQEQQSEYAQRTDRTAAACLPQNTGEPAPDRQVVYAADRAVEQQDEPQKQVEQA